MIILKEYFLWGWMKTFLLRKGFMMSDDYRVRILKGSKRIGRAYLSLPEIETYREMGYVIKVV